MSFDLYNFIYIICWTDVEYFLFWNRSMRSDNIVLHTFSYFIHNRAMAVGSVYNVDVLSMSHTRIKNVV